MDGYFAHLILPSAALVLVSTKYFEFVHGAFNLLISKHFKPTGIRTSGVGARRSVRGTRGLGGGLLLHTSLQTRLAENISTAVSEVGISAG